MVSVSAHLEEKCGLELPVGHVFSWKACVLVPGALVLAHMACMFTTGNALDKLAWMDGRGNLSSGTARDRSQVQTEILSAVSGHRNIKIENQYKVRNKGLIQQELCCYARHSVSSNPAENKLEKLKVHFENLALPKSYQNNLDPRVYGLSETAT